MIEIDEKRDLLEKINILRTKLEEYLSMTNKPTETDVVRISQELDKLLVAYYKIIKRKSNGD